MYKYRHLYVNHSPKYSHSVTLCHRQGPIISGRGQGAKLRAKHANFFLPQLLKILPPPLKASKGTNVFNPSPKNQWRFTISLVPQKISCTPHSFSKGRGRIPRGGETPKFWGRGRGSNFQDLTYHSWDIFVERFWTWVELWRFNRTWRNTLREYITISKSVLNVAMNHHVKFQVCISKRADLVKDEFRTD